MAKSKQQEKILRLALPKGHMEAGVLDLLLEAGIQVNGSGPRNYRPRVSLPGFEAKMFRARNIVEMLHIGSRDLGFSGADWVAELKVDLVEVLDTGLDPVRIVAAVPKSILVDGRIPKRQLVVASEYKYLTEKWTRDANLHATFVRSYGATEVFPPEDADCIVDNTASGSTLRANGLKEVAQLMTSSTRLYANPTAMKDPTRRDSIDHFTLLLQSVLESRKRVMVEVNVARDHLESVVSVLPCMREPTVSPLYGDNGYAVKAAVPRDQLPTIIPKIKRRGGTDIVVTNLNQIVP